MIAGIIVKMIVRTIVTTMVRILVTKIVRIVGIIIIITIPVPNIKHSHFIIHHNYRVSTYDNSK